MAQFRYVVKDSQGQSLNGIIEANDNDAAVAILHKKGLAIINLTQFKGKAVKKRKVKLDDLVIFSRQLATMVDSGISLVQALSILSEQEETKTLPLIIQVVKADIESGSSLCDALAKHPTVFPEIYINMVKAGETSGKLDEILDRLATYLEKASALQRKIRSSLIYPTVVISLALIITTVLLVKVVPIFKNIFDTLGGTLPLPTQILIAISDVMRKNLLFAIIGLVILVSLFQKIISTPKGRYKFDQTLLKVPVFGPLFRKVAVAKFSRTLATLVKSGVTILNALAIVGKTSGNKVIEENVMNACASIKEGEPIAEPLSKGKVFPLMVVKMISVGEQTGELEKMLNKIADFYDEQVDAAVSGLVAMIEPLVIAFLGIVIGGIVVSLFLPIFKITEMLGR